MNIVFLSGAKKNAGDYLIVDRCKKIVQSVYPNSNIAEIKISQSLEKELDIVNKSDILVVPGGPVSVNEYPMSIPLCSDLNDIKVPMIGIGLGWYGRGRRTQDYINYIYSDETKTYLKKLKAFGEIACRDWYTINTLKNNGITGAVMTGCPAWYNLDYINLSVLRNASKGSFKKICISDPAKEENKILVLDLVHFLQNKFPDAEIHYVFHRGIQADGETSECVGQANMQLKSELEKRGIHVSDISYSEKGLKIYDDCDFHIGFRVHAHIYNLSCRNKSILIEEDGRGAGINDAVGLRGITAYDLLNTKKKNLFMWSKSREERNPWLIREIDDFMDNLERENYKAFEFAFQRMQYYFSYMIDYIKKMSEVI